MGRQKRESISIENNLVWYEKSDNNFIGKCKLDGINILDLLHQLRLKSEDYIIGCYLVISSHVKILQKFFKHQINLAKYGYFTKG